jgi:hypothetical protein
MLTTSRTFLAAALGLTVAATLSACGGGGGGGGGGDGDKHDSLDGHGGDDPGNCEESWGRLIQLAKERPYLRYQLENDYTGEKRKGEEIQEWIVESDESILERTSQKRSDAAPIVTELHMLKKDMIAGCEHSQKLDLPNVKPVDDEGETKPTITTRDEKVTVPAGAFDTTVTHTAYDDDDYSDFWNLAMPSLISIEVKSVVHHSGMTSTKELVEKR